MEEFERIILDFEDEVLYPLILSGELKNKECKGELNAKFIAELFYKFASECQEYLNKISQTLFDTLADNGYIFDGVPIEQISDQKRAARFKTFKKNFKLKYIELKNTNQK